MGSALDSFLILRQLNAAKISSLKACCVILLFGFFLAVASYLLLNVNTALPHFSTLNEKYPLQSYLQNWSIPRTPFVVLTLGLYVLLLVVSHLLDFERFDFEPHLRFLEVLNEGSVMISIWYLFSPISSLLTSAIFLGFLKQAKVLSTIANDVPIKLHRLDLYQLLANMLTRITIAWFLLLSVVIAIAVIAELGQFDSVALLALISIVCLPLLIAFGHPIWIIRCRVHETQTIEHILNEIDGLDLTIDSDRNQHAYLVTQQMFVESRWEWPIASHVQKLILFGLLPPTTWVLAAAIENVMY